jgi:hypothetical protein
MLHVTVTNVLEQTRVVEVDPVHAPEVWGWPTNGNAPSNWPPPRQTSRVGYICTMGDDRPQEPPSPDRVRLALAPGAALHFDIEWLATWEARDADCKPMALELPPGDYRLYMLGPLLTGEVVQSPLEVR